METDAERFGASSEPQAHEVCLGLTFDLRQPAASTRSKRTH